MSLLSKFFKIREQADGDIEKPFLEHMEDLRWTLIKIISTLAIGTGFAFLFVGRIVDLLRAPKPPVIKLIMISITGTFVASLELAFFGGIILTLPFVFYFLAAFILPALTRKEKKYLFPGIACSTFLFLLGAFAAYKLLLPKTLLFFANYSISLGIEPIWEWKDYVSFCVWMIIGCGLLCQVPIVIVVLAVIGIVDFGLLSRTRAYAITGILILAAIISPTPDPVTFITMAAPIILLYEICIWIVWFLDKRKKKLAAGQQFPD